MLTGLNQWIHEWCVHWMSPNKEQTWQPNSSWTERSTVLPLKTWLSVKLLFHRLTAFLQEALRRGQPSGDTLAFLSLPPSIFSSLIAQPLQKMISSLLVHAREGRRLPMRVCTCAMDEMLHVFLLKHTEYHTLRQMPAAVNHTASKCVQKPAAASGV